MDAMPYIGGILLVIVLIAVALLISGGWAVVTVIRVLIRGIFGPGRVDAPRFPLPTMVCRRERCRAANPPGARFCRRCGVSLYGEPQPLRRVAMW